MRRHIAIGLSVLTLVVSWTAVFAQEGGQSKSAGDQASAASAQEMNIQEYIELLRTDVRQQKAEILGAVMELDLDQAAKFWPIYSDYDGELTKLNNLRIANIRNYADNYTLMTDATADELVQSALDYRKQRLDLLAKYYGRVKTSLGAIQAARFLQVEDQLLELVDLQIASALPIVGQE